MLPLPALPPPAPASPTPPGRPATPVPAAPQVPAAAPAPPPATAPPPAAAAAPAAAPAPPPAAPRPALPAPPPLPAVAGPPARPAEPAAPPLVPALGAIGPPLHESIGAVVRGTVQAGNVPPPMIGLVWMALHSGPGAHLPSASVQGVTSMPSLASIALTCCAMFTYSVLHVQSQRAIPALDVEPNTRKP